MPFSPPSPHQVMVFRPKIGSGHQRWTGLFRCNEVMKAILKRPRKDLSVKAYRFELALGIIIVLISRHLANDYYTAVCCRQESYPFNRSLSMKIQECDELLLWGLPIVIVWLSQFVDIQRGYNSLKTKCYIV